MENPNIQFASEIRDSAYRAYTENKTHYTWQIFCKYRNCLKGVMRRDRNRNFSYSFSAISTLTTMSWIESPSDVEFENFYTSEDIGFSVRNVSTFEIWTAICRIKTKTVVDDGIPLKFVKK